VSKYFVIADLTAMIGAQYLGTVVYLCIKLNIPRHNQ